MKMAWGIDGVTMTVENRMTEKKNACSSVTLSTTNLTWTGLGWNLGLRGERVAANRVSHYLLKFI